MADRAVLLLVQRQCLSGRVVRGRRLRPHAPGLPDAKTQQDRRLRRFLLLPFGRRRGPPLLGLRRVPLAAEPVGHQSDLLRLEAILLRPRRHLHVRRHPVVPQSVERRVLRVGQDADNPLAGGVAGQIGREAGLSGLVEAVAADAQVVGDQLPALLDLGSRSSVLCRRRARLGLGRQGLDDGLPVAGL